MNCHDVENIARDIANGELMEVALREEALLHADSCAACAMRLSDERALTHGLERLAFAAESAEAPARVETSLLTAFRERSADGAAAVSVNSLVSNRRWLYVGVGVAAAIVILVLIALIASRPKLEQAAPQKAEDSSGTVQAPPSSAPKPQPERRIRAGLLPDRDRETKRRLSNLARSSHRPFDNARSDGDVEIATDFFPLMNRESLAETESGQLVRVELPRSALMSFGLPMNMDRASERIKADVVVGNDGLARAIRFVR
ncbi:MAG TPA: hypothetical protein VKF81_01940 [Blastocatellia bacterium]|nr:hypothetical protein [Blastocatellia bacterium]